MLEKVIESPIVKNLNSAIYDVLSSFTLHQYSRKKISFLETSKGEWSEITYSPSGTNSEIYIFGTDKKSFNEYAHFETTWFACSLSPFSISISAKYEEACSSSYGAYQAFYGSVVADGSVYSKAIEYRGKTFYMAQLSPTQIGTGGACINTSPVLTVTDYKYEQYEHNFSYNNLTLMCERLDAVKLTKYSTSDFPFTNGSYVNGPISSYDYYNYSSERSYNDVLDFLDYGEGMYTVDSLDYINGVKALAYIILFGYKRQTILWNGARSDDPYVFVDGVAYNHVYGYIYDEEMDDFVNVWTKSGHEKDELVRPQVQMPEGGTT